ncbi:MAG: lysylphosphatidylglycerol synthase transmembrane domain-containing protein [Bacteroidales bacterium]
MNIRIRQITRFTLFLAAGLLLLYFAFRGIDFSEMAGHFREAKYSWIGISLIFAVISHISRSRRWILLIEPLNHTPKLWNTINAVLFGYLANYALPRAGEVTRCISLGKKEKIPVDSLIGTVIVERTIDLFSMFVILFILLVARFEKFGAFFSDFIFQPIGEKINAIFGQAILFWILVAAGMLLIVIALFIFRKRITVLKPVQKVLLIMKGVVGGLKTVVRMKRKWEFLFHTLFIWFNYAMMTWVIVFSLPHITGDLKFVDGIFLLVIGSMGMAVPVQSGIGAFHWIVSRGLHYVYGLEMTEGLVFATLQHESQTLLILVLGSMAMFFLFSKNRRIRLSTIKKEIEDLHENKEQDS